MHRTEGLNHLANLFTDGPPGTRIEEDWLNAVQEEIAYIIEQSGLTLKTATTETRQQFKAALDQLYFLTIGSRASRARFTYNGAATAYTIKLSNGAYRVKDKVAKWVSELTTSAIAAPVADTRYYLYLDYSAITQGTDVTASELIWSTTAPTYNQTYGGWYNGDDLCIFGVITNAAPTDILSFYHNGGDLVYFEADNWMGAAIAPSNVWTDVDLSAFIPAFSTKIMISILLQYVAVGNRFGVVRANGSSGGGHNAGYVIASALAYDEATGITVMTDSTQIIEARFTAAAVGDQISFYVDGWFFPIGM